MSELSRNAMVEILGEALGSHNYSHWASKVRGGLSSKQKNSCGKIRYLTRAHGLRDSILWIAESFLGVPSNPNPLTRWMWVINRLVPGWGTGPEEIRFPGCLVLPHIGTWFSYCLCYRLIWGVPDPAARENCLHFSIFDRKTESL